MTVNTAATDAHLRDVDDDVDHRHAPEMGAIDCATCERHARRAGGLMLDLENAERELRAARRKAARLENELEKQREQDPRLKDAKAAWGYWKERCKPNAREFSGKRLKNVLDRLNGGASVEDIKLAIDGAAAFANISDKTGEQFNDIELICRDASKLNSFMARGRRARVDSGHVAAEKPDAPAPAGNVVPLHGGGGCSQCEHCRRERMRKAWDSKRKNARDLLCRAYGSGSGMFDRALAVEYWPCPCTPYVEELQGGWHPITLNFNDNGGAILSCVQCGRDTTELVKALEALVRKEAA